MWERFGFYSMIAMFTLYLRDDKRGFGWTADDATKLLATYLTFVYASPLVGGWIADKKLGYRTSVLIGGLIFMIGYALFTIRSETAVYAALVCLVVGNGFFKPNVSAMVGHLYTDGSPLKDSAYNIFYMGINIGASWHRSTPRSSWTASATTWPSPSPLPAWWSPSRSSGPSSSTWCRPT